MREGRGLTGSSRSGQAGPDVPQPWPRLIPPGAAPSHATRWPLPASSRSWPAEPGRAQCRFQALRGGRRLTWGSPRCLTSHHPPLGTALAPAGLGASPGGGWFPTPFSVSLVRSGPSPQAPDKP